MAGEASPRTHGGFEEAQAHDGWYRARGEHMHENMISSVLEANEY